MRITPEVEAAFSLATREAARRCHEYVTLEHLVYALMFDAETADALKHAGCDVAAVKARLVSYLDNEVERLTQEVQPGLSLGFQRVVGRAAMHVQTSGKNDLRGPNVLIALFAERDSPAAAILDKAGVTRFNLVNYVSHGISKIALGDPAPPAGPIQGEPDELSDIAPAGAPESWSLDSFPWTRAPGLSEPRIRALGELGFISGAENVVFIGPTGTGKTGLASAIFRKSLEKGNQGVCIRAQDMFDEMSASRANWSAPKLIQRFAQADVLLIDEPCARRCSVDFATGATP